MLSAAAAAEDDTPARRRRPAKSCVQCRRRKIKCDQNIPCGPCSRAKNATFCSYRAGPSAAVNSTAAASDGALAPGEHYQQLDHAFTAYQPAPLPPDSPVSLDQNSTPGNSAVWLSDEHSPRHIPSAERTGRIGSASHGVGHGFIANRPDDRSSSTQSASLEQNIQALSDRVQKLQQLLQAEPALEQTPCSRTDALERTVRELQDQLHRAEQQLTLRVAPRQTSFGQRENALCGAMAAPRMRIGSDKTRFFGQSHWLHTLDQFHVIGGLRANTQAAEVGALIEKCRTLRRAIKGQRPEKSLLNLFPDLRDTIPDRATCDQLVHHYLQTFELIYRVLHIPSFWKEYNRYWDQGQAACTRFMLKLVLVLAIGTTFYQDKDNFDRLRSLAPQWVYAAQWWLTGPAEKTTLNLDGMQIYCLLVLARQTNSLGGGGSIWITSGSLIRFAFSLGLHRDPRNFPDLSIFHSEIRRRLWATVLELVVQSSVDSAMPPLFSFHDFDCEAPSNINDKDIDETTKELPISRPSTVFTQTSIQILLQRSLRARLEIARSINDFRISQSYDDVLALGKELNSACHEIALFFQSNSRTARYDGELGPTEFHRKLLDMSLRRFILFLHRPFMIQARKEPRLYYSRKVCLESSMIIISTVANLNLPSGIMDDFLRLTVLGSGTFKGAICLDAITIICLEIITQLEEEAPSSATLYNSATPLVGTNVLNNVARSTRGPLIQSLEHLLEQFLHIIALGDASMKRYILLSAALSQIKAMEAGQSPKLVVTETLKQSLENCYSLLHRHVSTVSPLSSTSLPLNGTAVDSGAASGIAASGFDLDFLMQDPGQMLDFSNSWLLPVWDNNGNYL